MRIAYFDCFAGISGDMMMGALLDLGLPLSFLKAGLESLPLAHCDLAVSREQRLNLTGTCFRVTIAQPETSERTFRDIRNIIAASALDSIIKDQAIQVFHCLAQAEARIHGHNLDDVHFHELGSADTIIDIVGSILGIHYLKIEQIIASALPLGSGFVQCRHGVLPVPTPATLEIVKGIPVRSGGIAQEMVTPTGAALIATLADRFGPLPPLEVEKVGYGAGERNPSELPNLLRIILGRDPDLISHEGLIMLETNIDDMNPEIYEYIIELLFERGALDVFLVPVHMKKNRPGTVLKVIAEEKDFNTLLYTIFQETTTSGVRRYRADRFTLPRKVEVVDTPWGKARVKMITDPEGHQNMTPEYEDCKRLAKENNVPLKKIYQEVTRMNPRK